MYIPQLLHLMQVLVNDILDQFTYLFLRNGIIRITHPVNIDLSRLYTVNSNLISMNFIAKDFTYDLDILAPGDRNKKNNSSNASLRYIGDNCLINGSD